MKTFDEQNFYELLEVPPSAPPFDIRHAYKTALQLYGEDSPVSYSFFSGEERKRILARLEQAFVTLMNDESRDDYDRRLVAAGALEEGDRFRSSARKPVPIFDLEGVGPVSRKPARREGISAAAADGPAARDLLSKETVEGRDLRCLRTEMGISLERIAETTKVRPGLLRAIEEDRYDELPSRMHLRSFLKAYAECLHVGDPASVVGRYMKRLPEPEPVRPDR